MNPLTREALLTLVDEASDEQILSALSQTTTSVLLYRFLLRQYMIDLTSIPGNKIDHKHTLYLWSNIFGYVELQQQRKRATVCSSSSTPNDNDNDNENENDNESEEIVEMQPMEPSRSINKKLSLNINQNGNLFRRQTNTIAEDDEEDEFVSLNTENYGVVVSPPITPPIAIKAEMAVTDSSNGDSLRSTTPVTPIMHIMHGHDNDNDNDNKSDNKQPRPHYDCDCDYDLSDDSNEIMVEYECNFRASLFMKVWLKISSFLHQNDKLLSLQFVSKKFRTIAFAANHWTDINIKLTQTNNINNVNKLCQFVRSINSNISQIVISNIFEHNSHFVAAIIKCLIPNNICSIIFLSDCNCNNMSYSLSLQLSHFTNLRVFCCNFFISDIFADSDCSASSFLYSIQEFWLPNGCNINNINIDINEWFIYCFANNKLSNLKILSSFPFPSYPCIENENIYKNNCFSCNILRLIADNCSNIEYICIDCKLENEFADTFKYLISKCDKLNYIQLKFNIAYNVNILNETHFFNKLAQLKINCLNILQQLSANYGCASTPQFFKNNGYKNYNNLYIAQRQQSDIANITQCDLQFTLEKR